MSKRQPEYEPHPFCLLIPEMPAGDLWELEKDIRDHGQTVPIVLYQEQILDGRSRYKVVRRLKKRPYITEFTGTDEEALNRVVSLNLRRRHLSPSELAAVAYKIKKALMTNGMPEEPAETAATTSTGASPRYVRAYEAIAAAAPEKAEQIARGQTTIHAVEAERAAPDMIDKVLSHLRTARVAASHAADCALRADDLYPHQRTKIKQLATMASQLVNDLSSQLQES